MKSALLLLAGSLLLSCVIAQADIPDSPRITTFRIIGNQAVLEWVGGRANYQLQAQPDLNSPWTNLGSPTTSTSAVISAVSQQGYFRIVSDYTAQYRVVFDATWSQASHPTNWPVSAHFSGLVGATHNGKVHFWRDGETASEGIRLMAELGQKTSVLNEVSPAITSGTADFQVSGGGISPSPGSVSLTFPQAISRDFPLVTLVSMIAPSPDWFVGVDSLNLIENGRWVTNKMVSLYGKDAGTDSGTTYTSADQVTVPRDLVTQFTGFPAIQNGVIVPFGTFTFIRLD
jgi:hypothetical protein